ncbi:MAG: hypothetical protein ACK5IQ_05820 [Bacteroidales bacterium]
MTLIALTVISVSAFGQLSDNSNNSSPYSRFGVGTLSPYSLGSYSGMGGASIGARRGNEVNLANPASNSGYDSLAFIMQAGLFGSYSGLSNSDGGKATLSDGNFSHLVIGFPIARKIGISAGVVPFSNVGYEANQQRDNGPFGTANVNYYGSGTLSEVFIGAGWKIAENLSIGANVDFVFGELTRTDEVISASSDAQVFRSVENIHIKNVMIKPAIQYTIPLKSNRSLTLGAFYETKLGSSSYYSLFERIGSDTTKFIERNGDEIGLPASYGVGLSYELGDKLMVNADFFRTDWSDIDLMLSDEGRIKDLQRYSVGAEYTPNSRALKGYYKKISYRAGAFYEQGYVAINGHQIDKYGITIGAGFPIKAINTLNVAIELGQNGKKSNGLIREDYAKLSVSFNFYELWFRQYQYK